MDNDTQKPDLLKNSDFVRGFLFATHLTVQFHKILDERIDKWDQQEKIHSNKQDVLRAQWQQSFQTALSHVPEPFSSKQLIDGTASVKHFINANTLSHFNATECHVFIQGGGDDFIAPIIDEAWQYADEEIKKCETLKLV